MVLRQNNTQHQKRKEERSTIAELAPYWSDPQRKPNIESRKWSDLFDEAMAAKYSKSTAELLHGANETDPNKAKLNNLEVPLAESKCVSVLYL